MNRPGGTALFALALAGCPRGEPEIDKAMATALARDFHAALFVRRVRHGELLFLPRLMRAAMALRCLGAAKRN
jgi:hypothetical protein